MSCCSSWWMWILPMVVLWWVFASAVVHFVWNRVITEVTTAKRMQFTHALFLVFALGVLCAPHHMQNCRSACDTKMGAGMEHREMMEEHAEPVNP